MNVQLLKKKDQAFDLRLMLLDLTIELQLNLKRIT